MTRKQALKQAIKVLSEENEFSEVVSLLKDIYDELPLIHWTDKSIQDTVEQFIIDNGRNPTATDFRKKGMPSHPVIKQKYKMTLGEWLEKNYPTKKPTFEELKNKCTKQFVTDYYRIKPKSQEQFSKSKTRKTANWRTVAKYYNVNTWRDLIKTLELPFYFELSRDRTPQEINVNIHSDYDFTEDL